MLGTDTVASAFEQWLNARISRGLAPDTIQNYERSLTRFAEFVGPDTAVEDVSTTQFEAWLGSVRRRCKASTANNATAPVRTFFAWASKRGVIAMDPTWDVPRLKVPVNVVKRLTHDEVQRVLYFSNPRTRTIIILAVQLGLRRAELARLNVEHWDKSNLTLLVNGKGDKQRVVPVTREAAMALRFWVKHLDASYGPMWPSPASSDGRTKPNTIYIWVKRACVAAGVPDAHTHILRHTAGSDMAADGATGPEVRDMLGHATLATTTKYLHTTGRELRRAAEGRRYESLGDVA